MKQNNENNLTLSTIIQVIAVLIFFIGLSSKSLTYLTYVGLMIMGFNLIYFSQDIANYNVLKYKINSTYARYMCLFVGSVFSIAGLVYLVLCFR
jgi:hypothetical protein